MLSIIRLHGICTKILFPASRGSRSCGAGAPCSDPGELAITWDILYTVDVHCLWEPREGRREFRLGRLQVLPTRRSCFSGALMSEEDFDR